MKWTTSPTVTALLADSRPLMPLVEAGAYLGLSRNGSYEMQRQGSFPVRVLKVGKRLKVRRVDLLEYLGLPSERAGGAA